MKKNISALLLAFVLAIGSIGPVPTLASETTEQQNGLSGKSETEKEQGGASEKMEEKNVDETNEEVSTKEEAIDKQDTGNDTEINSNPQEQIVIPDDNNSEEISAITEDETSETDNDEDALSILSGEDLIVEKGKEAKLAEDVADSGNCGENITWVLTGNDDDLTLTISGNGDMEEYDYSSNTSPWYSVREAIKKVVLDNGITSIGSYAFYNCSNLTDIIIPDSITKIGLCAFDSTGITMLNIPENVTTYNSFGNCPSLKEMRIPSQALKVPNLFDSVSLEKITVYGDAALDYSYDGLARPNLTKSLKELVFEEGITSIGPILKQSYSYIRSYEQLERIHIPKSVTEGIGFTNTKFAKKVTIVGYENSSAEVFARNNDFLFESIGCITQSGTLQNGIEWSLGTDKTLIISGAGEVNETPWNEYLSVVERVVVQEGITKLGTAFCRTNNKNCITSVELPSTLTAIGVQAFANSDLKNVEFPIGLKTIEEGAFENSSLESIVLPSSVEIIGPRAFLNTNIVTVDIPESVKQIGNRAFYGCESLECVRIPNSVLVYSETMFEGLQYKADNPSLKTIIIYGTGDISGFTTYTAGIGSPLYSVRDSIETIIIEEGITGINTNLFYGMSNLSHVSLPSTIYWEKKYYIGYHSFQNCPKLKTLGPSGSGCNIEYAWEGSIPYKAFNNFSSVESVQFPENLTQIGECAFEQCDLLDKVVLPEGIGVIGSQAFYACGSLTSITIPNSVTSIKSGAFSGCSSLSYVFYNGTEEEWNAINIEENNETLLNAKIFFNTVINNELGSITSVNMMLQNDITVKLYATFNEVPTSATMTFTMNGVDNVVSGTNLGNGKYVFCYEDICPEYMGEDFSAVLTYVINGSTYADVLKNYSIKKYCMSVIKMDDSDLEAIIPDTATPEETRSLMVDTLLYGSEAQNYVGYNTNELVTNELSNEQLALATEYVTPTESEGVVTSMLEGTKDDNCYWYSVQVHLDKAAKLRMYFMAPNGIDGLKVKLDGVEYEIQSTQTEGKYFVEKTNMSADSFGTRTSAMFLKNDITTGQTLSYSMNTYAMQTENHATFGELAKRLYNYGKSAKAYTSY